MKSASFRPTILAVATVFGLAGCAPDDPPIRIGATMSETGAYASPGIPARNGYRLCETDANEEGGLLGRQVRFVIHDDESDPEKAITLCERLITEQGVDAVMGPHGSTLTEAVAPVTEAHGQVLISPLAASSSIWEQGRRYLFMVLPPAERFLAGLIEMAAEHGLETIAVLAGEKVVGLARRACRGPAPLPDASLE